MKVKNHSKMHRLIQLAADGWLTPSQKQVLETHLAGCADCRAYADELKVLEAQLASVSVTRLVPPKARATVQQVAAIQTSYRRHTMKRQMISAAGVLVTIVLVAVLIVLAGRIVPKGSSPAVAPTATTQNEAPTATVVAAVSTLQNQPLGYFIHTESDTRPVETPVPGEGTNLDSSQNITENLSITEAAQLAGFDVLEPTWIPKDLVFSGASFQPKQRIVSILYFYTPNGPEGNGVALEEQPIPENGVDCEVCSMLVGASAVIEEVQIGNLPGEYVDSGVWEAIDDSGQWGWDADPPIQKLRWQANGVAFDLSTMAGVSKEDLFAIAESIPCAGQSMAVSAATPQRQPLRFFTRAESDVLPLQPRQLTPPSETLTPEAGFIANLTVTETEQLAGFDVLEPTGFPLWLIFKGASFDPQLNIVRLFYNAGFVLREERLKTNDDCELCGVVGASAAVETVLIGNIPGEYVAGVWNLTDKGPVWESTPWMTWMKTLRWQANGMAFELRYNPPYDPYAVTLADMIAIAESLH